MSFNKDDVVTMAKAMQENHTQNIWNRNNGDYIECIHCDVIHDNDAKKIRHELDCPVLIAQDIIAQDILT